MPSQLDLLKQIASRIKSLDDRVTRLETLEFSSISGGGGGWSEIETITIDTPTTTISFLDIPQTYLHLVMIASLRSTGAVLVWNRIRFNNDAENNYWYHAMLCIQDCIFGCSTSYPAFANFIFGGIIPDVPNPADSDYDDIFSAGHYWIPDYRNQYKKKSLVYNHMGLNARVGELSANIRIETGGGFWQDTSPITRIDFFSTSNYAKNSKVSLYGIQGMFEEFA